MQPKESKSYTHFGISLIKSLLRIIACVGLYFGDLGLTAGFLCVAEFLGIAEEIF